MLNSFVSSIAWLGFIEILALGLLPFWCKIFSAGAAKILGYSRVLSLLSLSWLCWLMAQYGGFNFSLPLITVTTLALLAIGHVSLRLKFTSWRIFLYDQNLVRPYISYLLALLILIIFRSCSPEIYWGEKPLEFSLFNYLSRETVLPAEHPWAAGSNMSYYYMGFFSLAILQKISALDPSIGFNIAIAFVGASLLTAYESLFLNLRLSSLASSLSSALLTFGANLNPVYFAVVEGRKLNFDLFWTTTRNFTNPAFAEYPIWSLLFADLHPHVLAMPLVVCLLGLAWAAAYQANTNRTVLTICCGLLWGLLYSFNGWDFISTAILLAVLFGFSAKISLSWTWLKLQLGYIALLLLSASLTVLPFRLAQFNMFEAYWGWVTSGEYNKIIHICLHQGLALSLILFCTIALKLAQVRSNYLKQRADLSLWIFCLIPITIGVTSAIYSNSGQAWNVISLSVFITALAQLFYSTDTKSNTLRYCCLLVMAGACLISVSESFYLIDRMNTIFKGYQLLWPAFGISACVLMNRLIILVNSRQGYYISRLRSSVIYLIYIFCFSIVALAMTGTVIDLKIMLPNKRTSNKGFTLNGSTYLETDNPDEAYLIRWLQKNVPGKAYIAEANGDGYQGFARVTMHTGFPDLLGWEYHTKQGGVPQQDLTQRKLAVKEIFAGDNYQRSYNLLQQYGIDFVFVGKLERETYPSSGINKFDSHPELFIPVAWKGNYTLYLTNFSPLKHSILTVQG